jgi:hypothetical protein
VRVALLVVAALLTAGCTTAVEGPPQAPTGVVLPPRPRDVRLEGVDPCSLLTAEQRAALGMESEPRPGTISSSALYGGDVPICTINGFGPQAVVVGIGVVTTAGVAVWSGSGLDAAVTPTSVSGFPAVTARPRRFTDYCSVDVDIAQGQLVDIQFGDGGNKPPIGQQNLCARAQQTAEAVVSTLLAR